MVILFSIFLRKKQWTLVLKIDLQILENNLQNIDMFDISSSLQNVCVSTSRALTSFYCHRPLCSVWPEIQIYWMSKPEFLMLYWRYPISMMNGVIEKDVIQKYYLIQSVIHARPWLRLQYTSHPHNYKVKNIFKIRNIGEHAA